ncbi:hypothetical protein GCM10025883_23490 [Mobilicoccus caccae]|uniref:Uncharacterized protein n=1 Tax=Mobilicoccus caccae TaxID=1859295 RepID=A0ABQ6IUA5_9MICO|nr:hypothetical protein GCM10025883_23490 [Mobilicoccus caccae]
MGEGAIDLGDGMPGQRDDLLALGRRMHPPGRALQQPDPHPTLQLGHRATERGLCDVQARRGRGEPACVDHSKQDPQVTDIHIDAHSA